MAPQLAAVLLQEFLSEQAVSQGLGQDLGERPLLAVQPAQGVEDPLQGGLSHRAVVHRENLERASGVVVVGEVGAPQAFGGFLTGQFGGSFPVGRATDLEAFAPASPS